MKLSEYLNSSDKKITITKLAKKCKVTPATLHNLMNKGRDIKSSLLCALQRQTKGEVTCMEIFEEFIEPNLDKKKIRSKDKNDS